MDDSTELNVTELEDPWPTREEALATARSVAERAREIYGDILVSVWMYGSRARGDHWNESDLDLLLVMSERTPRWDDRYSTLVKDVFMEYVGTPKGGFIEIHVCHTEQFEEWDTMFYRSVRAEALRVA